MKTVARLVGGTGTDSGIITNLAWPCAPSYEDIVRPVVRIGMDSGIITNLTWPCAPSYEDGSQAGRRNWNG